MNSLDKLFAICVLAALGFFAMLIYGLMQQDKLKAGVAIACYEAKKVTPTTECGGWK